MRTTFFAVLCLLALTINNPVQAVNLHSKKLRVNEAKARAKAKTNKAKAKTTKTMKNAQPHQVHLVH